MEIPGNILVVDNAPEDVNAIITTLRESGNGVFFFNGPPEKNACPPNIRLVILDLDLDGCGSVTDNDVDTALLVLQRVGLRTKFYLIALWSNYIMEGEEEEWTDKIRSKYFEQTGEKFSAFFLKPFRKAIGQENLIKEIKRLIGETPHAGIVFEWEKLIENARDTAVTDIVSAGEICTIVESIEKETGRESVTREIVQLFNKILLRHSIGEGKIASIKTCVEKILEQSVTGGNILEWYSNLHYLNAYYTPAETESHWTGDVFKTAAKDQEMEYAIVITPACDFAQKKVGLVKVVYGLKFEQIPDYDYQKGNVPPVVEKIGKRDAYYRNKEEIIGILIFGKGLAQKFYVLFFLKEQIGGVGYFHLLLDFQNVGSFETLPSSWRRICRVDSPWIDDILQKYASLSARIGTPDVPEDVRDAESKRLKGTQI